jgi:hypothetical protein
VYQTKLEFPVSAISDRVCLRDLVDICWYVICSSRHPNQEWQHLLVCWSIDTTFVVPVLKTVGICGLRSLQAPILHQIHQIDSKSHNYPLVVQHGHEKSTMYRLCIPLKPSFIGGFPLPPLITSGPVVQNVYECMQAAQGANDNDQRHWSGQAPDHCLNAAGMILRVSAIHAVMAECSSKLDGTVLLQLRSHTYIDIYFIGFISQL